MYDTYMSRGGDRIDAYYSNRRHGYLVKVFGVHLKTKAGKERRFESYDAAVKAAEKYIKQIRRVTFGE